MSDDRRAYAGPADEEPNDFTLLVISGPGIAPYSARGLVQTYEPISASSHLERAVNGKMLDLSAPQMRLYKSKISCTDQNTPALSGIWPGTIINVLCVGEMSFPTAQPELQERPAVDGSLRVVGDYTFYRPIMDFIFTNHNVTGEEYQRAYAWAFDWEEWGG